MNIFEEQFERYHISVVKCTKLAPKIVPDSRSHSEKHPVGVYHARDALADNITPLHSVLFTYRVHCGFADS